VEARKLANLGFVDVNWLQVIPVEDCIAVCAPGRHEAKVLQTREKVAH